MDASILPLMKYIPALSPRFTEPQHLAPIVNLFERIVDGEQVRAVVSVAPRHGKTEVLKHGAAWALRQNPALEIVYAGYSQGYAENKSRQIRELTTKAGVPIQADASSRRNWRTGVENGGCWAAGVEGPLTGEGADVLIVDDPIKDRATAESALERRKLQDWFNEVAFTRLSPQGSVVVCMARWHAEDLAGSLVDVGWDHVTLPAIDAEGQALWPERYALPRLREIEKQMGAYGWASLYMGQPYPRGGAVFQGSHFYETRPTGDMRVSIGIDLAYSTKARADYSVAVVLGERAGTFYVLDVIRMQVTAPDFVKRLAALQETYPGAKLTGYFGGTEKGTLDMATQSFGLKIDARSATQDKFTRSQPVAAAWNDGKVLVRRGALWLDAFVSEVVSFTGVGDHHDDQVDALAGAFDARTVMCPRRKLVEALNKSNEHDKIEKQIYGGSGACRLQLSEWAWNEVIRR